MSEPDDQIQPADGLTHVQAASCERQRRAQGRPPWQEAQAALASLTPEERRAKTQEGSEYTVVDLSVLDGLARPRTDRGHVALTWDEARARLEGLAEPERSRRLAELDALQGVF